MPWAAAAGAVVGGGLSYLGSKKQAEAAKGASDESADVQRYMFDKSMEIQEPWRDRGEAALYGMSEMLGLGGQQGTQQNQQLQNLKNQLTQTNKHITTGGQVTQVPSGGGSGASVAGTDSSPGPTQYQLTPESTEINPEYERIEQEIADLEAEINAGEGTQEAQDGFSLEETPGYQFRYDQGLQALDRSAAASGNRLSGRAIKSAQRFGQGIASDEYTNRFNRLASIAGLGQTASQTSSQAAMTAGQGIGNAQMQGGMAAGQAMGQGYMNMNNALQSGMQNYMIYNAMQNYNNPS